MEIGVEQDDPLEACRRGVPDAQYRLFRRYADRVYSMALFSSRNAADAAEITQDVFLKVFERLHEFHGDSKFETWLFRIVVNTTHDHTRKSRRYYFLESLFWQQYRSHSPSIEDRLAQSQINESVRSAVASLPEKFRICVVLRYMEDLSYEEIADLLGCPASTVGARLNRAHKMLALKLAKLRGKP